MLQPFGVGYLFQPGRIRHGHRVERGPQRFGDQLQPVQRPGGGDHMRGVGAGLAAAGDQAAFPRRHQDAVQQHPTGIGRHQPIPELRQHRVVKPGIFQRQAGERTSSRSVPAPPVRPADRSGPPRTAAPAPRPVGPAPRQGLPRAGNSATKSASSNSTPSSSRTRIATLPLGNAALATRTVSAGTSPSAPARIDNPHPHNSETSASETSLEDRRHLPQSINHIRQQHPAPGEPGPVGFGRRRLSR